MLAPVLPYFTISGSILLQQFETGKMTLDETARLNILLDIPLTALGDLFSILTRIKNSFLFSIPASVADNYSQLKEILPACYMLSCLDNFSSIEKIVPVLQDGVTDPATLQGDTIETYFKDQGVDNISVPFLFTDITNANNSAPCSFFVYKTKPAFTGINIIGFTNTITDLATFNDCISHLKKDPVLSGVSVNYIEEKIYHQEVQYWQQRALLYRSFLSLSKSVQQKEYYEVLDWYQKEYEALPLWYKRFGHVIKVISGKRSFRSLFNDNIKKHTD